MRKQIRLLLMLALPMLLGLASCAEHDNPAGDPNPLAKQVSGLWWSLTEQEGTFSDATDSYPYTRMGQAIRSAKANTKPSDAIYSLNGTRRHAMQKGVNIVDGKKIIT